MKKILLVEDNPKYRSILKRTLLREGYLVSEASNGNYALDLLRKTDVDLILLDITMPGMDGLTFYYNLKNLLKKEIPTIILTNKSEAPYQADIKDFLIKANTSLEDLVATVKKYLG